MFKSQKIVIFDVEIYTSLEPGRKVHWNYRYENGHYFAESLESAIVHIISLRNNTSHFFSSAAKLLDIKY